MRAVPEQAESGEMARLPDGGMESNAPVALETDQEERPWQLNWARDIAAKYAGLKYSV